MRNTLFCIVFLFAAIYSVKPPVLPQEFGMVMYGNVPPQVSMVLSSSTKQQLRLDMFGVDGVTLGGTYQSNNSALVTYKEYSSTFNHFAGTSSFLNPDSLQDCEFLEYSYVHGQSAQVWNCPALTWVVYTSTLDHKILRIEEDTNTYDVFGFHEATLPQEIFEIDALLDMNEKQRRSGRESFSETKKIPPMLPESWFAVTDVGGELPNVMYVAYNESFYRVDEVDIDNLSDEIIDIYDYNANIEYVVSYDDDVIECSGDPIEEAFLWSPDYLQDCEYAGTRSHGYQFCDVWTCSDDGRTVYTLVDTNKISAITDRNGQETKFYQFMETSFDRRIFDKQIWLPKGQKCNG